MKFNYSLLFLHVFGKSIGKALETSLKVCFFINSLLKSYIANGPQSSAASPHYHRHRKTTRKAIITNTLQRQTVLNYIKMFLKQNSMRCWASLIVASTAPCLASWLRSASANVIPTCVLVWLLDTPKITAMPPVLLCRSALVLHTINFINQLFSERRGK